MGCHIGQSPKTGNSLRFLKLFGDFRPALKGIDQFSSVNHTGLRHLLALGGPQVPPTGTKCALAASGYTTYALCEPQALAVGISKLFPRLAGCRFSERREKVSDTKSAKHPQGRSGFWWRTPFPGQPVN